MPMLTSLIAFLLAVTGMVSLHLAVGRHHQRAFGHAASAQRRLRLRMAGIACLSGPALFAMAVAATQPGSAWALPLAAAGLAAFPSAVLLAWLPRWLPGAGSTALAGAAMLMLPLAFAGEPDFMALLPGRSAAPRLLLLGEVHDNAAQHALRLKAFEAWLASGARPALLMEQFDRERQADIDRLRAEAGGKPVDAQRLIDAAAASGARWQWEFYRPFVRLALEHGLPIVAANVSRSEARLVATQGLAALGFDAEVPADLLRAQADLIVASHCGMVDQAQGLRMAAAQVARDQFMARMLEPQRERGAVLLAGNGHVRRDIGVPRWLSADARSRTVAIGFLEEGDDDRTAYDHALTTPRQAREDPCNAMRPKPTASTATTAQTAPQRSTHLQPSHRSS